MRDVIAGKGNGGGDFNVRLVRYRTKAIKRRETERNGRWRSIRFVRKVKNLIKENGAVFIYNATSQSQWLLRNENVQPSFPFGKLVFGFLALFLYGIFFFRFRFRFVCLNILFPINKNNLSVVKYMSLLGRGASTAAATARFSVCQYSSSCSVNSFSKETGKGWGFYFNCRKAA